MHANYIEGVNRSAGREGASGDRNWDESGGEGVTRTGTGMGTGTVKGAKA